MSVRLEFIGKSISRRNWGDFLDGLRQRYSQLGEAGLHEMATIELSKNQPRDSKFVQQFIGADILGLGVDVTRVIDRDEFMDVRIDANGVVHERFLADEYQAAIDRYYRDVLPTQIEAWPLLTRTLKQMILGTPPQERERLVDPKGLSKTYVWRKSTRWVAEVSDADAAIIRALPDESFWFRDIDRHGRYVQERAWNLPVIERHAFLDPYEAKRYEREMKRTGQWVV